MSTVLDIHDDLKRKALILIFSIISIGGTIATILHRLETHPYPLSLIAPPLVTLIALILLVQLYRKPQSLRQVIQIGLLLFVIVFVGSSLFFIGEALKSPDKTLVEIFPAPLIPCLFLIPMGMLVFLRPKPLKSAAILAWLTTAAPVIIYLLLHPVELQTPRGMDLVISLGPAMGIQIALILFYSRLQEIVDRLYAERYQYYSQLIERQAIRQQAMEQAFTQIHNGPLQTLALLLRDVQTVPMSSLELFQRLEKLNTEIREVGAGLTDSGAIESPSVTPLTSLEQRSSEHILRLGSGICIDLNHPLHHLLYQVYSHTLSRDLPYFATLKVKVRNFAAFEQPCVTLEIKRNFCLWLEEALCNVGKHAQGATRIQAIGQYCEGHYILKVEDNGPGLTSAPSQQGTKQCALLAERLGGTFRQESLPQRGVICELAWPSEVGITFKCTN